MNLERIYMTHRAACMLTEWILSYNNDLVLNKSIIIYGIEAILSSIIGVVLLIGISFIFNQRFLWILFMLGFVPLRLYGGGYHAETHAICYFMTASVFLAAYTAALFLPFNWLLDAGLSVLSWIIIFRLAPVASKNKPLSDSQYTRNRRRSLIVARGKMCIVFVAFFLGFYGIYYRVFAFGFFAAVLSMAAGKHMHHF